MLNKETYKIIDGNCIDEKKKKVLWEVAINLNKIDELVPSNYFLELTNDSIDGIKSYVEIEKLLKAYYSELYLNDNIMSVNWQCDIVSTRMVKILSDVSFTFSPISLINIYKQLFDGVFVDSSINSVRNVEDYKLNKIEHKLNVDSVEYKNKFEHLKYYINDEKYKDYNKLSLQEQVRRLSKFTFDIWELKLFPNGNTRVITIFILKYLMYMGWKVNFETFKNNLMYLKEELMLLEYSNLEKETAAVDSNYLDSFFCSLLSVENR